MPILSYNAEVWGVYNKHDFEHWDKTTTEKAHLRFCKSYLALNKHASNLACRAEMGRFPTKIAIYKQILKYWYGLTKLSENSIIKQAFILSQKLWEKGHKSLHSHVDSLKNVYNFPQNILTESKFTQQYTKTMMSKYTEIWRNNLNNSQKLQLYSKIKTSYEPERYLNVIKNAKLKQALCKLRVSNHDLMIERGRYHKPKLPREQHLCPFCRDIGNKQVEDEMHFLCECLAYEIFREQFLQTINKKTVISSLSSHDKIFKILDPDISNCHQDIPLFVYNCLNTRSSYVSRVSS